MSRDNDRKAGYGISDKNQQANNASGSNSANQNSLNDNEEADSRNGGNQDQGYDFGYNAGSEEQGSAGKEESGESNYDSQKTGTNKQNEKNESSGGSSGNNSDEGADEGADEGEGYAKGNKGGRINGKKKKMPHHKKLIVYKIAVLIFAVVIFLVPNGVNSDAEIDIRTIALVIGIDNNDTDDRGDVMVSAHIIAPEQQGQSSGKQEIISGTGRDVAEALDNINVKLGRRLDMGHCGAVIFGAEKAKKGILEDTKYLLASSRITPEVNLIMAPEGQDAKELMEKANNLVEEASTSLNNFLKFSSYGSIMTSINIIDFVSKSYNIEKTAYIPVLEIDKQQSSQSSGGGGGGGGESSGGDSSGGESSGGGGSSESETTEIKKIDESCVFKDGKLINYLPREHTKGLVWANKTTKTGLLMAENVIINDKTIKFVPCQLHKKFYKQKVGFDASGRPFVEFKVTATFYTDDLHKANEAAEATKDFSRKEIDDGIKKAIRDQIEDDIETTLKETARLNCDVFNINQDLYRYRHKKYLKYKEKNPDSFWDDLDVRYTITVNLY